ncbi:MAG: hypothetical protein NC548_64670 [Lachnospiraceae bacterium]|nr:hypothetical protein [Lachnospiraceae bacterium]
MKESSVYKTVPLKDYEGGKIEFAIIEEPYGEKSKPVVSICVSLGDGKESFKLHIPLSQVKEVRQVLKSSKKAYKKHKDSKKCKTAKKDKAKDKTKTKESKSTKTDKQNTLQEVKITKKQPQ